MNEVETAWAAGLFEGEGCISVTPGKPGGRLIMRMTDRDVLERFQSAVGCGGISGPVRGQKPHHKPAYQWFIGKWCEVTRITDALYPYLGERRRAKIDMLRANPVTGLSGRQSQTHCKRNHPLTGEGSDVYVRIKPGGKRVRQCRVCTRITNAALKRTRELTAA